MMIMLIKPTNDGERLTMNFDDGLGSKRNRLRVRWFTRRGGGGQVDGQ